MRTTPRTTVAGLAVLTTLALGACSSDGTPTASSGATPSSGAVAARPGAVDAAHSDAEVTFVADMTPHHEGALAMTALAPARAGSAEVKALAASIAAAQGPELEQLKAMATAWDVPASGDAGHAMGSTGGSHDDDAATLEPLTGTAFDRAFLTRMTAHHQAALPMAQAELAGGTNAQGRELAQAILTAQTAEIAQMQQLLAGL